ncbi:hypothetical protein CGLO_14772 [Colletotrichum gloeosporioides Cg-14]|uniref:Uncharacterized protein n=1 Tax=Colletotrichum gloeosporioides (strain Cg-14) TaxID=1237896 RepID=T0K365_COLGC|nr:hypothetical protein CGLO_14772 [Colletotrichum gloeosporioides Cg-14]
MQFFNIRLMTLRWQSRTLSVRF